MDEDEKYFPSPAELLAKYPSITITAEERSAMGLPPVFVTPSGKSGHWFADSAFTLFEDMGYQLERGKVKNLVSFGDGNIDLWYFLALLPEGHRHTAVGEEFVNFILGPLAATLKLRELGFAQREQVVSSPGLLVMFEAMSLDLIPPGKRKNLYEALIARFNVEFAAHDFISTEEWTVKDARHFSSTLAAARTVFYNILTDVLAPIFDEASGDELTVMVIKALADNPKQADEAKTDPKVVGWLMGQVMRASPTKLDPNTVRAEIVAQLV